MSVRSRYLEKSNDLPAQRSLRQLSTFAPRILIGKLDDCTEKTNSLLKQDIMTPGLHRFGYRSPSFPPQTPSPSQRSLAQVVLEVPILEGHIRITEVRVLQCILRSLRQALPGNQRLVAALRAREAHLVVYREDVVVPDQGSGSAEARARVSFVLAVAGGSNTENLCRGRCFAQPDDDAFPIVAVAEAGSRRILGEVPRVHDRVAGAGLSTTDIDLAGAAGAATIRLPGGVEAGAEFGISGSSHLYLAPSTAGNTCCTGVVHLEAARVGENHNLLCITRSIHSGERNATGIHLQVGLELLIDSTNVRRDRFRKANNGIMGDFVATLNRRGADAASTCEEVDESLANGENHG